MLDPILPQYQRPSVWRGHGAVIGTELAEHIRPYDLMIQVQRPHEQAMTWMHNQPQGGVSHHAAIDATAGKLSVVFGSMLGWVMTFSYVGSRVPQLVKNYRRGMTTGLSMPMFVLLVLGSTTYVASIFVRSASACWMLPAVALPWRACPVHHCSSACRAASFVHVHVASEAVSSRPRAQAETV